MTNKANVDITIKEIRELQADDRGRITLGKDFSNDVVRVAILEQDEDE